MSVRVAVEMWSGDQVAEFARSYALAALSAEETSLRESGVTGEISRWPVHPTARERWDGEARAFADAHLIDLSVWLSPERAGAWLWQTLTGEGEGFWAGYLPNDPAEFYSSYALSVRRDPARVAEFDAAMQRLTDAAHEARLRQVSTPYLAQDGTIRAMP